MAIKTPHWAPKGTHPTAKGWMTPSGEVVKKQKFTAEQIAEWHGASAPAPAPAAPAPQKPRAKKTLKQTLHEAPVVETVIDEATEEFHYGDETAAEAPAVESTDKE